MMQQQQQQPLEPADFVHVLGARHSPQEELRAVCQTTGQEDAFYVCDVDDIVRKVSLWRRLMPRVRPHFAVKSNPSRVVLNTVAALGVGFDCASKTEIEDVLSLGMEANRIIFAHPTKPASHIRYAAGRGVNTTTFDNEEELYKIRALHPKCKLVLRIRYDAVSAKYCLGTKFGCDAQLEAPRLLRTARDLGLNVIGVSFHVGSGCREDGVFQGAIRAARGVFDEAAGLGMRPLTLLDIGGGFPGEPDEAALFVKMSATINEALAEHFGAMDVDVIAEPGLYLVHSAFSLAVLVHSKRELRSPDGDLDSVMYYTNDGVYTSFHDVLNHRVFRGQPLEARADAPLVRSTVWGPTCDGLDKVEADVALPLLDSGSWLVYRNMGSYTLVLATPFNGMSMPKVHAVASTETWLLLRRLQPFSDAHFVPSVAGGHRHSSASLVDPPRRLALAVQAPGQATDALAADSSYPPILCRRGSIIDQLDLSGTRPVY